jgi:hypothetical protein
MIGLVLIVILIAVGFLLYVHFGLNPSNTSPKQEYETTQLGQSFVDSLAKTELQCGQLHPTVEELIREIANGETRCEQPGMTTTQTLEEYVNNTLSQTLIPWGINYRLVVIQTRGSADETIGIVNFTNPNPLISAAERCNDPHSRNRMSRTSDDYLISGTTPAVKLRLEQCG